MDTNKISLDEIATTYDSKVDFDFHLIQWNYREIKPRILGPAVLELGCASGVMTNWLSEDFPVLHVVDGSAVYLREVSSRIRPGVVFHHALFEDFQCPRRFNDIIMARALEHLEHPVDMLRKIHDWLEPGGRLHIVVPNAQSLHRRIGVYMGMLERPDALSQRDCKYGHRRVYDADLLRQHLSKAEWRTEQVIGIFLKPLSNAQMLEFNPDLLEALFEMGRELPCSCAELYAIARSEGKPR